MAAGVVGGELVGHEMAELPDVQIACSEQGRRVEPDLRGQDGALGVGEPRSDRFADAETMPFEREAADDPAAVLGDCHACLAAVPSDPDDELRAQERAGQSGRVRLQAERSWPVLTTLSPSYPPILPV
ncbi:hypothetical protein ITP53_17415 [Nonomuraea sp. K274]|uniref:Uncharacterized protein n=1 Tax=Nonomuraea cypriaca TaxID=1187855 RepID=A0A931A6Y3_9ACTN|nr:hypothetical protein [Nonomuraea cypriaca]MBF8187481.1 hypothetical protein [Nonomuraea cypriaca]